MQCNAIGGVLSSGNLAQEHVFITKGKQLLDAHGFIAWESATPMSTPTALGQIYFSLANTVPICKPYRTWSGSALLYDSREYHAAADDIYCILQKIEFFGP